MLTITRENGETITIGDNITITVVEIKGGQVKLGIHAPKGVAVHREEIYRRIRTTACSDSQQITTGQRRSGTISSIVKDKGYGFIYTPGAEKEVFFHASSMPGPLFHQLEEGLDVESFTFRGKRGLVASDIILAERQDHSQT